MAARAASSGEGPFGALVVSADGELVGTGTNQVVATSDPTAHAEMVALRAAAASLGSHVLAGCTLYASCEPCPMCLGAAFWARIELVVFAADRHAAAAAGFDDVALHGEVCAPFEQRRLPLVRAAGVDGGRPFEEWLANPDRVPY